MFLPNLTKFTLPLATAVARSNHKREVHLWVKARQEHCPLPRLYDGMPLSSDLSSSVPGNSLVSECTPYMSHGCKHNSLPAASERFPGRVEAYVQEV